jgi:hypothetical protein
LEPKLQSAEIERSARKIPSDLTAYDLYLRSLPLIHGMIEADNTKALEFLRSATQQSPDFALAHALGAWCYLLRQGLGWPVWRPEEQALGLEMAEKALRLDRDDPTVLWVSGMCVGYLAHKRALAVDLTDRALRLNPNSALGWMASGWARTWVCDCETALENFERAKGEGVGLLEIGVGMHPA